MEKKKQRVFISTPITNAIHPETGCYDTRMAVQINRIAESIRARGYDVFVAIEEEKWGEKLAAPEECTPRDYQRLLIADYLIVYLTTCTSEGTLIEIGWASANQIPITVFCPKEMKISPLLDGLSQIGDHRIFHIDFENMQEIEGILMERLR